MKKKASLFCLKILTMSTMLAVLGACGGGGGNSGTPSSGGNNTPVTPVTPVTPPGATYVPLSWDHDLPLTQYQKADGTLVTRIGGRVRDRHAREADADNYNNFAPHYFEKRTNDITIYDNADPANPAQRILTVVIRPQWWLFDLNIRDGYMGFPGDWNKYNDNENADKIYLLKDGQTDIQTPIPNYDQLPEDEHLKSGAQDYTPPVAPPGSNYTIVKQIKLDANALDANGNITPRPLRSGDLVEIELGIFLAGEQSIVNSLGIHNRFNYYADALVYQVGKTGVHPWIRHGGNDTFSFLGMSHTMSLWSELMPPSAMLGGQMTLQEDTSYDPAQRLMQVGTNIAGYNMQPWVEGRRLFHTSFLTGAHSEINNPIFDQQANKVGPRLSQTRCVGCHVADGKSSPGFDTPLSNMGVFIGDSDAHGAQTADPRFGTRLREGLQTDYADEARTKTQTIDGREAELRIKSYLTIQGQYKDGTPYTLQKPQYVLNALDGSVLPLPPRLSLRAAPHLSGMGLLEAVPESEIDALAKSQPADMAGRMQIVPDPVQPGVFRMGRFGWKANAPTVSAQVSFAFNDDMSVTTPLRPTLGCSVGAAGQACRERDAQTHGQPMMSAFEVDRVTRYVSLLGVPSRRQFADPLATDQNAQLKLLQSQKNGERLFNEIKCAVCHAATLTTADHRFVELRNQTIHPYTDLLLHDMGNDLADDYLEGRAKGSEWRTAPLWGIGVLASVDPNVRYLHDGRARTLEEAILWHGGQAASSRDRFSALSKSDRDDLIEFLRSL